MNKTNINNHCLVCNENHFEQLITYYSRYNPRYFHKIAICMNCGHIQQHPLFGDKEYENINTRFFGKQYMAHNQENSHNNQKKLKKLNERLSSYLKNNLKILDVGAGEAWAMNYFQSKQCNYYAIESVDRLSHSIQERGGKVIGETIFSDYSDYSSYFDIIIFRHILEHLTKPLEALKKLRTLLATNGKIYIALPNAANPSILKGFRTSYIRPVHISYFCEGNVIRIAHAAGLKPIYSEAYDEIYCLLTPIQRAQNLSLSENHYSSQKRIFENKKKEAFAMDLIKIVKDIPKSFIKRLAYSVRT